MHGGLGVALYKPGGDEIFFFAKRAIGACYIAWSCELQVLMWAVLATARARRDIHVLIDNASVHEHSRTFAMARLNCRDGELDIGIALLRP